MEAFFSFKNASLLKSEDNPTSVLTPYCLVMCIIFDT